MDAVSPILAKAGASYVINKLMGAATTYLRDQYYWKTDLQEELQNLKDILPKIKAVVGFAEQRLTPYEASNPALMEWLQQFRDGIDEAEEMLDELEYRELEKKSDSDKSTISRAVDGAAKRLRKSDDVFERLRTCVKNLNTSASDVEKFLALVTHTGDIGTGQMQQEILPLTKESRITSALPALSFKGREEEKGKIIHYLLGESEIQRSENVHCLPLVAVGGMGKTALAQQVFDHFENVQKEHFHVKFWVCVSTDFNASGLMKKILEYPTGQPESGPLERLPVKLKEELHSKRFLLVLDDVWDDKKQTEWEKLCAPLLYGQKGSWILLTTRLRSVVKMVSKVIRGTMEPMKLLGLSEDECRSLLYEHAFAGENSKEFPLLKKIGEEIVEKLDGVPLLAKSIGGALNSKLTVDHWMRISRSEVWKMPHDSKSEFIPALTLSYVMLPPQLKRCFSYCGIFPEDYQFNKQKLVGMWVAAGLIYSDGSEEGSDEDIASRYFDMLCNKSFFDVHTRNYLSSTFYDTGRGWFRCGSPPLAFLDGKPNIVLDKERDYYTMHDMLNGLARHVSRYECCRIVHGAPCSILNYNAIRHIFISSPNTDAQLQDAQLHDLAKMVCKLKHVRTLWIQFYKGDPEKLDDFIRDACGSPRRIRVLIIDSYQCLESISNFVKLRFLDISAHLQPRHPLSRRPWQSLSKSTSSFYFLQVLIGNEDIPILAKDANKLTNLRHLYGVDEDALRSVAEVGKLTSLQELCFSVGTESGHRIDELMNMNDLHQLKIEQLSNVRSLEEANKASLVKKRNLTRLELHYQDGKYCMKKLSCYPDLDQQEVLAALRPPRTIRELFITDYKGGRPAPWMDTSSLSWLESLELYACTCLEELPPLWKLPCLKFLKLYRLEAIKSLGCHSSDQMDIQFPVLEKLLFNKLPLWEEWNGADDYIWFPRLKGFEIDYCPKLKKIPDLPLSIEYLKMENLGLEALPRFYKYSNGSRTFGGLLQLTSLESLEIDAYLIIGEDNDNLLPSSLKNLKLQGFLGRPKFLSVEVESQKLLEDKTRKHAVSSSSVFDHSASNKAALPSSLVSLKLQESDISQESLGRCLQGLTSLEELQVSSFDHLVSLPNIEYLHNLTTLRILNISYCKELCELDSLTTLVSLRRLGIWGCPKLLATTFSTLQNPATTTEESATKIEKGILPSLEELFIDSIFYILILPTLVKLKAFSIIEDTQMPDAELTCFPSEIEEWLFQCQESLEYLTLRGMRHLQSLPASLESFSSLKRLTISPAPELKSLPRMPASLRDLMIYECSAEFKKRCQENMSPDWPNIKHIPNIHITTEDERLRLRCQKWLTFLKVVI